MRSYTMKQAIKDSHAGAKLGGPEFEAEVERDAALANELHERISTHVLLPFLSEHPAINAEVTGPALLRLAAMHVMVDLGMGPDDFAELAREIAKIDEPKAKVMRAKIERRGQA